MAARLAALGDYSVDTEFDRGRREFGRGGLHPHTYARGTQRADPAGRRWVMMKHHQGHVQLDARVDMRVCAGGPKPGIGADEVHPERPRSQGAQSFYHYRQAARRIGGCSQHTQSTGIGDRGGKLLVRDESHTRAHERMPEAILPGQPGRRAPTSAARPARRWPSSITGSLDESGMASPSYTPIRSISNIVRFGVLSNPCRATS